MEKKEFFNDEEIKCLRKMFKLASLTKYSLVAIWINFLPLIFLTITDFVRYHNNISRNFLSEYLYSDIIVMAFLLIIWSVFYIILRKNLLNNKIWQNILEKIDNGDNVNTEVENINSDIKSIIPKYLFGDLISSNKNLKEVGNTIKTISGIAVMVLIVKSCSIIMKHIRNISKAYNISLKSNYKFYFILFIIPAFVIVILDITTTLGDIKNGKTINNTIIDSLKENCEQNSYCNSISSYGDEIKIEFNKEPYSYSKLKLDESKKVKSISTNLGYNKNMSKNEIVNDANTKIRQITNLINSSNITCTYNFICQEYQLSNEFINKFYNISDTDVDGYNNRYNYELGNQYSITTYSHIEGDEYSNPTDIIYIHFIIDK